MLEVIVGTKDTSNLRFVENAEQLMLLAERSVPPFAERLQSLVNNQLYWYVLSFRNMTNIPYRVREAILKEVEPHIGKVSGLMDEVVGIEYVMREANLNNYYGSIFGHIVTDLGQEALHSAIDVLLKKRGITV